MSRGEIEVFFIYKHGHVFNNGYDDIFENLVMIFRIESFIQMFAIPFWVDGDTHSQFITETHFSFVNNCDTVRRGQNPLEVDHSNINQNDSPIDYEFLPLSRQVNSG